MRRFCENPYCENPSVKEVPVSAENPADQIRSLCAVCKEACASGAQHGRMPAWQEELWISAVANRGVVVHIRSYCSEAAAVKSLVDYLHKYDGYDDQNDADAARKWLNKHDEHLSADIVRQNIDFGNLSVDSPN